MDDGFHRTPLVHGRLKALQYVFPRAVGVAQYQLSNELNSFGCAAQYDRWARADTQLWIDWKVRHGQLTPGCGRGSIRRGNETVRGNSFRTAQSARKLLPFSSSEGSVDTDPFFCAQWDAFAREQEAEILYDALQLREHFTGGRNSRARSRRDRPRSDGPPPRPDERPAWQPRR